MAPSERAPLLQRKQLPVGEFAPAPPGASTSPCPVLNALANHGYIERDGRRIYAKDLNASMAHVGMSSLLGSVFALPTYFEYQNPAKAYLKKPVGFWTRLWQLIMNPYSFFSYFGCWQRGNVDKSGKKFLDLEDIASHGAIEHDISLSRRDHNEKEGNNLPDKDLIKQLLECSKGEIMTTEDLGAFIKQRIRDQLQRNPGLSYTPQAHQINCGQVALMMGCFGDGKSIKKSYVKAIFEDERLPREEGWKVRSFWSMGLFEFFGAVQRMQKAVNVTI